MTPITIGVIPFFIDAIEALKPKRRIFAAFG